jgi:tetratricopeptide (TPR) repeat protein
VEGQENFFNAFPYASETNVAEIICLLAIAQDDLVLYEEHLNKIKALGKNNEDYRGYVDYAEHYFQGIIAFRKERFDESLFHFESLDDITLSLEDDQSQFYFRPMARFMRAEILMRRNRYDEALGFLENFWTYPGNIPLIPWAYLRRAEIYEAQGRNQKAIDFYGKFITLYESSDAQYQPFVQKARKARDELIISIN